MSDMAEILRRMEERLANIEAILATSSSRFEKNWFTVAEVADLLGKRPFTIREWCRNGRVNAKKRECGRGRALEWILSREEIERIGNEGLLPIQDVASAEEILVRSVGDSENVSSL